MVFKPDFKKYHQTFLTKEQIRLMAGNIATEKPGIGGLIKTGIQAGALFSLYWLYCKITDNELLIDKQKYELGQTNQDHEDVND